MIWNIVKKQGLQFIRNPQELLLLIGLPILLITILGIALSSWMDGESPKIQVKVAFIQHSDEHAEVEGFMERAREVIPPEAIESITENSQNFMFVHTLRDEILGSNALKDIILLEEINASEKESIIEDDSFTAIIEVPEDFTYDMLNHVVMDEKTQPALKVIYNDTHQVGESIVRSILTQYQQQLTLGVFLEKNGLDQSILNINGSNIVKEATTIEQNLPITSKDYYSVGMAAMNVLFLASAIGAMAFREKEDHVFDRVILANVSRWTYFISIFLSGMAFGFIQLLIIYGYAWLVFGVTWPDLFAFFIVTLAYAAAVGGITVLLTAICYRINSEVITNFFSGIIVTIMAFLGGSFFPIGDSSAFIQKLGDLTPNGAGMSAYLSILRGNSLADVQDHVSLLVVFSVLTIVIASISFPKRGQA
ncbi:ABC transporter permease [Ornithinibacillus halophilus]|uniref:ABC-2 type transport system permease protein n=1 Tax=Ornithinibacillus halophilus TaxID=930117 RepID=A0A1M5LZT7_9BACI|nr:ABC transporter permease [Ornithinibacillus halophilus]SHG70199.1 ABC-2 type transport system permease protein [Ornithinibacillus halophilus]